MREKVRSKYDSLKQTYDVDLNETVTKGEFRRVLESYCFPMTSDQFDTVMNKVEKTQAGSIKYTDFLQKFYGPGTPNRLRPVSQNLKSVVRGMQLFDYNMDGKIQRHELRRVLENYCFKFTDNQFDKLWLRYDFHHTGLVNYRDFLQRLGVNVKLQGKPAGNNAAAALKWPVVVSQQQQQNPTTQFASTRVKEQQKQDEALLQVLNFDQIEIEFRSRMRDNYLKLKRAFMAFDKHLDGFVSIEDLRAILSNFTLPMSDQLFGQLMARCGVRGTGRVAWELFLEKFQSPVSIGNGQTLPIQANHKFHPVMETQQTVDWDTIWKQLYKHVQNGYSSIRNAFLQFDKNRDGKVTRKEFRQIVERFTFRLDDQQFKELMKHVGPTQNNRVSYHDFLNLFEEKESLRIEDLLQEKITQYWKNVAENLMLYDTQGKGYITPQQLKRVIDRQVLPISDDHFAHLLGRCEDRSDSRVNYVEFLTKLKVDVRPGDLVGLSSQIMDSSGRAEIRRQNDQYIRQQMIDDNAVIRTNMMSADEVIIRMKDKMSQLTPQIRRAFLACDKKGKGRITKRQFRETLRGAFYKFDDNHGGALTKRNFRRMLDSFMIFMFNETFPPKPLTAEEAHETLKAKAYQQWGDLAKAFRQIDSKGDGIISKRELRDLLYKFVMPMTDTEFKRLWARYDEEGRGHISHASFLRHLGAPEHAPGDYEGPSQRIIDGSRYNLELHNALQQQRHEDITEKQAHLTSHMSATEVIRQLKDKIRDSYSDFYKAFRKYDTQKCGSLSVDDIQRVLVEQNFFITDEEFFLLLDKIGLYTDKSRLNYDQFLAAFEDGRKSSYGRRLRDVCIEEYSDISADEAEAKLRQKLERNIDDITRTLAAIDKEQTGKIPVEEFRRVLDLFCFKLTPNQWRRVKAGLEIGPDNCVNYPAFLNNYVGTEHARYEAAIKALQDAPPAPAYQMVTVDEVQDKIQEAVRAHYQTILRDLAEADYAGIGAVPRDEFPERRLKDTIFRHWKDIQRHCRNLDTSNTGAITVSEFSDVLNQYNVDLSPQDFDSIVTKYDLKENGTFCYGEFIRHFMLSMKPKEGSALTSRKKLHPLRVPAEIKEEQVGENDLVARVRECVSQHWKDMRKEFRMVDKDGFGTISEMEFRRILRQYNINLSEDEFEQLVCNYERSAKWRHFLQ
nr:hypothetical protein BaRGS_013795 [Batillaria attramentaria]